MTPTPQSTSFKVGKRFLQPHGQGLIWNGYRWSALTVDESMKEKEKQKAVPAVGFLYLC